MGGSIFMIHGMWGGPWYWANYRGVMEARGYRCVATTLPYHDVSPQAPPDPRLGRASLLDYAAALEREIRAMPALPILIGHSMGGLLAQMLAARGLARAAVLLTPASPAGVMALTPSVLRSFLPIVRWGAWRKPMRPSLSGAIYSMLHLLPAQAQREVHARLVYESGRAACEIGFWPLDPRRASRVDAAAVNCPLLVIAGARDRIVPASVVRKTAQRYGPHAQLRVFEDHAHWVVGEPGWQHIADAVVQWLDEVTSGSTSGGAGRLAGAAQ